jgi:SAM-dependent methyltransferase
VIHSLAGAVWWAGIRMSTLPLLRHLRAVGLRRLEPLSGGRPRGTPIVRHYWARFLDAHRADIRGHALEIGTTRTIREYGGSRLDRADAIDLSAHGPEITVVADLTRADEVASDTYDCFVNQFTMHVIHDVESALYHSVRILKPGGVLLVNFVCVDDYFPDGIDMGTGKPMYVHWWFTPIGVENLLRRAGLGDGDYQLTTYGNLFARIGYQLNMAAEELAPRELASRDPAYPLLVCVRAVKPEGWSAPRPALRDPWLPAAPTAVWTPERGHHVRATADR